MEVVIAFGRFNPPTTGHAKLISFVQREAAKRHADVVIFPSQTTQERQKNPKNPLPFGEKVGFLKALFPQIGFNQNERIHTIFDALGALSNMGYDKVWVVAGSDRTAEFAAMKRYIKPKGRRGGTNIILPDGMDVIPVPGNRDPDSQDVTGMSASKMRAAAVDGDWKRFRSGVPTTNDHLAKRIYTSVRRHMGLKEATKPRAFFLHGFPTAAFVNVPCASLVLREVLQMSPRVQNLIEMCDPFVVDTQDHAFADIKRAHAVIEAAGYAPIVYARLPGNVPMTESTLWEATTRGLVQQELARSVVLVRRLAEAVARINTVLVNEVNTARPPGAPKVPTEVDRLKDTQKQQLVLTKQRQAQELLQAKQRELAKKSRDDMNKIKTGTQPRATTQ